MSAPIVVLATFTISAGKEDDAREAFAQVAAETHREDGCDRYAWVQALENPSQFAVVEKWSDQTAIDGHGQSTHLAELRAKLKDLVAEPPVVVRYSELGLGTPEQGLL
jgi:quinol monooxygenase YgiN